MKTIALRTAIFLVAVFVFSAGADARPTASVKFSTTRAENPKGVKNSLVLPYAFSSNSMGFTLGVGGGFKGYGQDQLLLAGTAIKSEVDGTPILGEVVYRQMKNGPNYMARMVIEASEKNLKIVSESFDIIKQQ